MLEEEVPYSLQHLLMLGTGFWNYTYGVQDYAKAGSSNARTE